MSLVNFGESAVGQILGDEIRNLGNQRVIFRHGESHQLDSNVIDGSNLTKKTRLDMTDSFPYGWIRQIVSHMAGYNR